MIKELKEYIDNKFGKYDGSITPEVVQCEYNDSQGLDLYVFSGEQDAMAYIGSINENYDICNTTKTFYENLLNSCFDIDENNINPEVILKDLLSTIMADNIFMMSLIVDIDENIKKVMKEF